MSVPRTCVPCIILKEHQMVFCTGLRNPSTSDVAKLSESLPTSQVHGSRNTAQESNLVIVL